MRAGAIGGRSADAERPEAGREGEPGRASVRRLLPYLRPYAWPFAGAILCNVASATFDALSLLLLIPFLRSLFGMGTVLPGGGRNLAERALDWLVGGWIGGADGLEALRVICLVLVAALLLKNLFFYAARLLSVHVQERIERDLRDDVYGRLQRLPLRFFERAKAGQIMARVLSDTRRAKGVVSYALADALRHVAQAAAYLTALFLLSWRLSILALLLAPLVVGTLRPLLGRLRRRFREAYGEQGELLAALQENVAGVRLVKAFGGEAYEERRFRERSDRYARGVIRAEAVAELASPLSESLSALVAVGLVWAGAHLVLASGTLGPEQFLAFVTIALRMISPVKRLAQFPARAQDALGAADRFFELLDAPAEPYARAGPAVGSGGSAAASAAPATFRGPARSSRGPAAFGDRIRFEDVWFSYEPGRPVLRGVELEIARGSVVALVGPSGAGKSTLADLLPRFIEPERGRVTLDGTDLREIPLESLRASLGFVGQETVIFHDSVRANLAYGAPDRWSAAEIEAAARAAHAHGFIGELPDGYDTPLGDRGVRLSGGQRQRIAIARALLRDPPILILDEATSSLDLESERLVRAALRRLFRDRTALVIAHRLSTVQEADLIAVLDRGRVIERGTHRELLARGGAYRRLCEPGPGGGRASDGRAADGRAADGRAAV